MRYNINNVRPRANCILISECEERKNIESKIPGDFHIRRNTLNGFYKLYSKDMRVTLWVPTYRVPY